MALVTFCLGHRIDPFLKMRSEGELVYYGEPTGLMDARGRFLGCMMPSLPNIATEKLSDEDAVQSVDAFCTDEKMAWRLEQFMPYDARHDQVSPPRHNLFTITTRAQEDRSVVAVVDTQCSHHEVSTTSVQHDSRGPQQKMMMVVVPLRRMIMYR